MIQVKEKFNIAIEGDGIRSAKFSIHDSNIAKVFEILRNNLYSDKPLAVIREYSTNAYDANVENGKANEPIVVTLPTIIDPVFKVRDNGKGLTEDEIFNIYSSYGASTKENTNDQVGMLGMGSKSGFAYANSFSIVSYNGGYRTSYEAFIDESNVGMISKIDSQPSNEPTGIEIIVPVPSTEINNFTAKAYTFYKWFTPTPTIINKGYNWKSVDDEYDVVQTHKDYTLYKWSGNYYYNNNGSDRCGIKVKMGNIVYPVNNEQITNTVAAREISNGYLLVLNAEIGEITFTASRESLEYSAITIKTINRCFDKMLEYFAETVDKRIAVAATPWEAILLYNKLDRFSQYMTGDKCVFKGKELDTQIRIPDGAKWKTYTDYNKRWSVARFNPHDKAVIALRDKGVPSYQIRPRLLEVIKNHPGKSVIWLDATIEQSEAFSKKEELKGADVVMLSSIGGIVTTRNKKNELKRKHDTFKWNGLTMYPYSNCWEEVDETKLSKSGVKVYVDIDKYNIVYAKGMKIDKMREILRHFANVEGKDIGDYIVYGRKKPPTGKGWIKFHDWLLEKINSMVSTPEYANHLKWDGKIDNYNSAIPSVIKFAKMAFDAGINDEDITWFALQNQDLKNLKDWGDKVSKINKAMAHCEYYFDRKAIKYPTVALDSSPDARLSSLIKKFPVFALFEVTRKGYGQATSQSACSDEKWIEYFNLVANSKKNP